MYEIDLRQAVFTYSAKGPLIKNKERKRRFKKRKHSRYIHQNKLDKAYFHHHKAYESFKYLDLGLGLGF